MGPQQNHLFFQVVIIGSRVYYTVYTCPTIHVKYNVKFRYGLKMMEKCGNGGSVVNVSSVNGLSGFAGTANIG